MSLEASIADYIDDLMAGVSVDPNGADVPNVVLGDAANATSQGIEGATVGGGGRSGFPNLVQETNATVGGGYGNVASGLASTVSGGAVNTAGGFHTAIGGGSNNLAADSGATVAGGSSNQASGPNSAIPGGDGNEAAGRSSLAAGTFARATHDFTFVWDSIQASFFESTKPSQFLVRADGGVGINTNNTPLSLSVKGLGANSELIGLRNDADQAKWHLNLKSGGLNFVETGVDDFRLFLKEGGNVGIGTSNPQGRLDVNGTIFQRGGQIHADYVFEDDYQLESIEEHARAMWRLVRPSTKGRLGPLR